MERGQKTAVSIDWAHWAQIDLWTLRQGTLLLVSLPPDHVSDALMAGSFPELIECRRIRSLAEASVASGALVPHDPQVLSEPQFVPREFVAWADSKKIAVPDHLHCLLEQGPNLEKVTSVSSSKKTDRKNYSDYKWEEITITVTSDNVVRIGARGQSKKHTGEELGFADGRVGDKLTMVWGQLLVLARFNGELTNKDMAQYGIKESEQFKQRISALRKRLREWFDIDNDPFYRYKEGNEVKTRNSYKTKFKLVDDRQSKADLGAPSNDEGLSTEERLERDLKELMEGNTSY